MKNKKTIFIVAGIIAVITIVIAFVLILNKPKKELEEEKGNQLNVISKSPDVILRDDGVARYVGKDEITTKVESKNDVYSVIEEVKDYFKIEDAKDVLEVTSTQESGDFTYYKLSQKYSRVKVYGNELIVTVNKDHEVTSITGKYVPISNLSTSSSISIEKMEENLSTILNENYEVLSKEKYIYIKDGNPIYCYVYTLVTINGLYDVFIDAKEGIEVDRISKNYSADYSYTGKDIYGENKTISINSMDNLGVYQLHDNNRNISIVNATNVGMEDWLAITTHLSLKQSPAVVNICKDGDLSTDLLCINNDTNFIKNSIIGMDNFARTYDYYNNVLGRKSYDNKGAEILVNIGVINSIFKSEEYDNAGWSRDYKVFIFGSKNSVSLAAALDVVAHEYTHAVSGSIVGFVYKNESGALNESYSDILGSLIEGKNFEIAEDFGGRRDMTNPNRYQDPMIKDGDYYFPTDENTYNQKWREEELKKEKEKGNNITDWKDIDNGGVHTNSGVPNYTAFLMYDNGAFASKEEMAKVWYNSLFLLSSNADFEDCALAVVQSAINLGLKDEKVAIIENAFKTTKMLDEEYGSLSGKVISSANKEPLQGTVVTAINQLNPHVYFQTTTNENGEYKFDELSAVDYVVTFEMPKHKTYEEKIAIKNEENSTLDVTLEIIDEADYKESEIVFVLDISSSMDESDPTNIRKQIIQNIVSSLGSESKVALVTFASTANLINDGLSSSVVDKKILITDIFNMVNEHSGTNGRAGLETGLNLFNKDSKTRKYIVFLTDGKDNTYTGPTYDEIIKQSKDMGIRILTIGLGSDDQLDEDILIKLASGTNGKYYHATKSSNLYEFDKRIFAELE